MTVATAPAVAGTWVELSSFWLYGSLTGSGDEYVRVSTDGTMSNPDSCSSIDGYVIAANQPAGNKQRYYSMLLTAHVSQRPVYVLLNGCDQGRPAIANVALPP